jgi:hypothetical protein
MSVYAFTETTERISETETETETGEEKFDQWSFLVTLTTKKTDSLRIYFSSVISTMQCLA